MIKIIRDHIFHPKNKKIHVSFSFFSSPSPGFMFLMVFMFFLGFLGFLCFLCFLFYLDK